MPPPSIRRKSKYSFTLAFLGPSDLPTQGAAIDSFTASLGSKTESSVCCYNAPIPLAAALINARSVVDKIAHLHKFVLDGNSETALVAESKCSQNVFNNVIMINEYRWSSTMM